MPNLDVREGSMFLDPCSGFQNECVITLHFIVSLIESRLEKYFHM